MENQVLHDVLSICSTRVQPLHDTALQAFGKQFVDSRAKALQGFPVSAVEIAANHALFIYQHNACAVEVWVVFGILHVSLGQQESLNSNGFHRIQRHLEHSPQRGVGIVTFGVGCKDTRRVSVGVNANAHNV